MRKNSYRRHKHNFNNTDREEKVITCMKISKTPKIIVPYRNQNPGYLSDSNQE